MSRAAPARSAVTTVRPRGAALGWLTIAAAGALAGAFGHAPGWLLVAGVLAVLLLAPVVARVQLAGLDVTLPPRLVLHPGHALAVDAVACGDGRDLLVRLAEPDRLERARPTAIARLRATPAPLPLELRVQQRGRFAALELEARTAFPFGLFEARVVRRLACDVLVRPRLLREGTWSRAVLTAEREGAAEGRTRDPAGDFFGLREWRAGEPPRRVRWSVSARRGRWLVDERRGAERAPAAVLLLREGAGPGPAFERAVSAAACLVELLARSGRPVTFSDDAARGTATPRRDAAGALARLATSAGRRGDTATALAGLAGSLDPGTIVVVAPEAGCDHAALAARAPGVVIVALDASSDPEVWRADRGRARGRLAR